MNKFSAQVNITLPDGTTLTGAGETIAEAAAQLEARVAAAEQRWMLTVEGAQAAAGAATRAYIDGPSSEAAALLEACYATLERLQDEADAAAGEGAP